MPVKDKGALLHLLREVFQGPKSALPLKVSTAIFNPSCPKSTLELKHLSKTRLSQQRSGEVVGEYGQLGCTEHSA